MTPHSPDGPTSHSTDTKCVPTLSLEADTLSTGRPSIHTPAVSGTTHRAYLAGDSPRSISDSVSRPSSKIVTGSPCRAKDVDAISPHVSCVRQAPSEDCTRTADSFSTPFWTPLSHRSNHLRSSVRQAG